ncbi:hypothetical protein HCH_03233 [Hahella chejuensis KCTC 2396]|uniref:Uncharacterized protein n=1 Tax=Hahella chejuensis (strain KCTC 2396) TaxID=349521 RepID=Q2SH81_HAHCH|nr:hypothetical protein [Hahella chejuensis]ABC29993.1 hypothetical protein HCH_03233 [Hahella chejuensis KCTC 2396]
MNIAFKCLACGGGGKNGFREVEGFPIAAYDGVIDWSDYTDEIPPLNDNNWWMRSEETPVPGDSRVINVRHPFNESAAEAFWTLYTPACSSINGWEEHLEEIDASAFVKCQIERVLSYTEQQAWLKVKVLETITFVEVLNKTPQTEEGLPIVNNTYQFEAFDLQRLNDWMYFSGSAEGDLGNWMLIKQVDGEARLIAFGEWSFHQQCAYLGNISISDETLQTLKSWCRNI